MVVVAAAFIISIGLASLLGLRCA